MDNQFKNHLHHLLQSIIRENQAFGDSRRDAWNSLEEIQNDEVQSSLAKLDQDLQDLVQAACTGSEGSVADHLTKVVSEPWAERAWTGFNAPGPADAVPTLTRIGDFTGGEAPASYTIPAMVPFLGSANIIVMAEGPGLQLARQGMNALLIRSVLSVRPGRCRAYLVDTQEAGRVFSKTRRLVPTVCRQPANLWDPNEIHGLLGDLVSHIEQVNRDHLAGRYADIREYNAHGAG